MLLALALPVLASAGEATPESADLEAEFRAAEGDGKPVVVLVRHPADIGSLDAAHWLVVQASSLPGVAQASSLPGVAQASSLPAAEAPAPPELAPLLQKFHRVALWHGSAPLKAFPWAPRSGLLFLTPKREPISVDDVPPLRAGLQALLARILEKPEPLGEEARAALAKSSGSAAHPDPDYVASRADARLERVLRPLPEDLRTQFRELLAAAKAAEKDPKAMQKAHELVKALLARPMTLDECQHAAGMLSYVVMELDFNDEHLALVQKIAKEAPVGRVAADAYLDLADEALAKGERDKAVEYWQAAEKAAGGGESPTLYRTALAMRALASGQPGAARKKWEERQVLDVVVLAQDLSSFAKALSCWTEKTFFPVLLKDDLYAPKFIAVFKPAQVILAPAEPVAPASVPAGTPALPPELQPGLIRETLLASWASARPAAAPKECSDDDLRARLKQLGIQPAGVVFSDAASSEAAGGLALAAGRFEGFEFLPMPHLGQDKEARTVKPGDQISKDAAWALARQVREGLARWGVSGQDGWGSVTLAGGYPYRYNGDKDGYNFGNTYALDDLLGRDADLVRVAATGRLLGDAARSAYQAACSLFLQPDSALLFNTYGTNPRSIWGAYRMDFCESQWQARLKLTHLKDAGASVETFRAAVFPWNRTQVIAINSSGGATDWSVGGGGGTADDFPVGGPVAIHVTHSGSAANPYDPDTLAGRAVWGGAFFYFGSVAEPFLSSFQPPRYYAPRLAAGAPWAAVFRQRAGQYFGYPWRLMIVGDPQFCWRKEPAARLPCDPAKGPVVKAGEQALAPAAYLAGVPKWLAGDTAEALALWQKAPPEDPALKYAARVLARQQLGHLMDQALAAGELAKLEETAPALLSTTPARNFVERWCGKLAALAEKKKEESAFATWLEQQSTAAEPQNYRGIFVVRLTQARLAAVKRKEPWTQADKTEALRCFAESVKIKSDAKALVAQLEELAELSRKRLSQAAADSIPEDARALFAVDSAERKRVEAALKELEKKRAPPK